MKSEHFVKIKQTDRGLAGYYRETKNYNHADMKYFMGPTNSHKHHVLAGKETEILR